jgi:hypothetical protein
MAGFRILRPIHEPAVVAPPTNGNAPHPAQTPAVAQPAAPQAVPPAAGDPAQPAPDPELLARREQLIEKFTIMQSDLGGAFYEMAIRDHVRLDVLTRKAAELQRVDAELTELERSLDLARTGAAGICPNCSAPYAPGSAFCSQCATPLRSIQGAS